MDDEEMEDSELNPTGGDEERSSGRGSGGRLVNNIREGATNVGKNARGIEKFFNKRAAKNAENAAKAAKSTKVAQKFGQIAVKAEKVAKTAVELGEKIATIGWILLVFMIIIGILVFVLTGLRIYYKWIEKGICCMVECYRKLF